MFRPTAVLGVARNSDQIFKGRNDAVHPDAGLHDPLPHPALSAAVAWPAHIYRYENAKGSVDVALHTALVTSRNPRAKHGKAFVKRIESWKQLAEDARDRRNDAHLGAPI